MDLNRMIKRVTGDFKYLGISIVLGLSILLNIFAFFDIISMSGNFLSALSYVITIVSEISLLIYALNYHGTRGSKLTLYAYFALQCIGILAAFFLRTLFSAVVAPILSSILSLAMFVLMMAVLYFGIRGIPVYLLTAVIAVINFIAVFRTLTMLGGFPGLLPFFCFILPVIVVLIACYLVATSTK